MENITGSMQDEATRNTAKDALFSKIYSAKLGYFVDDYSCLFNKAQRKMMPIINRGTWTRVYSIRTLVENFIKMFKDHEKIQILSLGAGLDTNYFYLQENSDLFKDCNVKYIEIDFPEITTEKIKVIKENDKLETLIFGDAPSSYKSDDCLFSAKYKLIPCDIRDIDLLETRLLDAKVDQSSATLVLTEWVLWYMDNADSLRVLSFLTKFFEENLAIANFEMIKPNDPFGMTMIENLEARGCMLPGLKDVPDEEAQINRMIEAGFKNASWDNMLRIHNSRLEEAERERIEKIEMFDEFEEWDLLQTHYCVCVASKFCEGGELTF